MIDHFYRSKRNTAIVRYNEDRGFGQRRKIDVWWGGLKGNGSLMMILAYLLRTSLSWRGADVTVKMVVPSSEAVPTVARNLQRLIDDSRTGAVSSVIPAEGRTFDEILRDSSGYADLIFMGMAEPHDAFVEYYETLQRRLNGLASTVLVLSAEDVSFGDVLIEKDQSLQDDARAGRS